MYIKLRISQPNGLQQKWVYRYNTVLQATLLVFFSSSSNSTTEQEPNLEQYYMYVYNCT